MHNESLKNTLKQFTQLSNTFGQEVLNFLRNTRSTVQIYVERTYNTSKNYLATLRCGKESSPVSSENPSPPAV